MPLAGGIGLGIGRLGLMLLGQESIREWSSSRSSSRSENVLPVCNRQRRRDVGGRFLK